MPGTKAGAKKAVATIYKKHGADFFKIQGAIGGRNGTTGGFATNIPCACKLFTVTHTIARCAGVKGGMKSRRPSKKG